MIRIFFPPPRYEASLTLTNPLSLRELCRLAGVRCRASGAWTERQIEICDSNTLSIIAEPGDFGSVRIELAPTTGEQKYLEALEVLAYGMHDLVAKESLRAARVEKLNIDVSAS